MRADEVGDGFGINPAVGYAALLLVAVTTLLIGIYGLRISRTTGDFYVASRTVRPWWNASAIGGEYLSAASFLGVAGLILISGTDALWFPIGYTAGYLMLLLFVAAPMRRSGAYTIPDFAQARLESLPARRVTSLLVIVVGWLYIVPQLHGAALTVSITTGLPAWVGPLAVVVVVCAGVMGGGMRSITFVQAFQFWLKLTAIAVPVVFLLFAWQADGGPDPAAPGPPVTRVETTVRVPDTVRVRVEAPVTLAVTGVVDGVGVDGPMRLEVGSVTIGAGSQVTLPAGAAVPHVESLQAAEGTAWATPTSGAGGRDHALYRVYSLLIALLFGTMGLPHVLVRFYTNKDGRAARRTTLVVLGLLGAFYVFPPVYGALGRVYAPDLLLTGRTDAVVLLLPSRVLPAPWGDLVSALVVAGAFAAFLSTASGLTVSVAGVLSQDLLRGRLRSSVQGFRLGAVVAVVVPALLSLFTLRTSLADTVGLAFALAASTFCPLLLLGIWWRGLTRTGALAGLLVGGSTAAAAVLVTIAGGSTSGLGGALLAQPAAWSMPLAFTVMVVGSLLTRGSVPASAGRIMARLHAPETLGLTETEPAARRQG